MEDMLEEERGLFLEEREARSVAASKFWGIERLEEISWRQKSSSVVVR